MINNQSHTIAILAFNNNEITISNIKWLKKICPKSNILLFDNGSRVPFKKFAKDIDVGYYREEKNIYVNPAWNKIFKIVSTKYLTLLNNDCFILSKNYFHEIVNHMNENKIILSSCKTIDKKLFSMNKIILYKNFYNFFQGNNLKYSNNARRQGWLMTLNLHEYKKLNFIIPNYLKVWYGDDWIWSQIIKCNKKYVIYKNRYAIHFRNKTISKHEIELIINEDKKMMDKKGHWVEKEIYKKSRIFNRYI